MTLTRSLLLLPLAAVLLAGCTSAAETSSSTHTAPATGVTSGPVTDATNDAHVSTPPVGTEQSLPTGGSSVPDSGSTWLPVSPDPAPTVNPTESEPSPPVPTQQTPVVTDLPGEVLLPDQAYEPVTGERTEETSVVPWRLPQACALAAPTAVAMSSVTIGTGEFEAPVGVQQVAIFSDVEEAVAEGDRLRSALETCAGQGPTHLVETIDVGAQGTGLLQDYYGAGGDDALGTYLAVTRRGNAVTLVANDGGEAAVGTARLEVVERTQAAWELLCPYDSRGC